MILTWDLLHLIETHHRNYTFEHNNIVFIRIIIFRKKKIKQKKQ